MIRTYIHSRRRVANYYGNYAPMAEVLERDGSTFAVEEVVVTWQEPEKLWALLHRHKTPFVFVHEGVEASPIIIL